MIKSFPYLLKEGLKNIWSNRTMSLASVCVLISCLLLTGTAVLFSFNINAAMKSIEGENSIKVYMKESLPVLESIKAGEEIKKLDNIASCEFVSKDQAIEQTMGMLGESADKSLLAGMTGKDNPLPDAFKISIKDLSKYNQTAAAIKKIDGVSSINNYSDIAAKLTKLDRTVSTAGFWVVLLLAAVSLFIISNTVRVTMFSRRLEINIMKSVGATNGFVRVPFLVEGVAIGVLSGIVSSIILALMYGKMTKMLTSITLFTPVDIGPVMGEITLIFILAGAVFGALGGMISIGRYLKREGGDIVDW